jgi:3',5'-cyclic AMP phosphodiesterase CpdA
MRLIHLTDPHLTSLAQCRIADLRGKRWSGYLSWRRKRRHQLRSEMLERLVDAALAECPEQVLVTGDLAHVGLPQEIVAARAWLERLGPPQRVFLVPGNHDVYAADSWPAVAAHWGEYLGVPADASRAGDRDAYPIVRRLDGVWLVGVSSALATAPFLATGALGPAQLARLRTVLVEARAARALVCLLIHHPPLTGLAGWRKRLIDAPALEGLLAATAVPLALHGHLHEDHVERRGGMRVFGTASAASAVATEPASYRVLDIEQGAGGWHCRALLRRHDASAGRFMVADEQEWSIPGEA